MSKSTIFQKILSYKYYILILFIILMVIDIYKEYNNEEGFQNFNWHSKKFKNNNEGHKGKGKSKTSEDFDDNSNPLEYFGFKSSKSENFNDTSNSIHSALDEAENINTDDISTYGMRKLIRNYNSNITKKLKKADSDDVIVKTINQGKVLIDEFKDLFNYELFFN